MKTLDERGDHRARKADSLHLRESEILCEECGGVYDLRTGTGLCRYCAEEEARVEEGAGEDD
jgi:Zn finger protein HypA/HybF involved in hydrogenase expression